MISWKWISGEMGEFWPSYHVSDIQYNRKTYQALPHSWSISVSDGCKTGVGHCHIRIVVEGTKCKGSGCELKRECGAMKDCNTDRIYTSVGSHSRSMKEAGFLTFW